ncbi:MAG: cysteine desulfurase [Oscillospiraceae bacterium]|nr:cysteine desulfurase [Oscillospiraceae bacterium]
MNGFIYLDNAATTMPSSSAMEAMMKSGEFFGNPSSLHGLGLKAEKLVEESRYAVAEKLNVKSENMLFTSGGTEANNTAVFGVANAKKKTGTRVITTKIEHPSVLQAFKKLETDGFDVRYIDVTPDGIIDLDSLYNELNEQTTLVSVMHVNNETGVIQPVEQVKEIMKDRAPNALLHSDCVQSFGKIDVNPKKMGADLVTVSAHKIRGCKGTGALYVSDMRMIRPTLYGGEQQKEMRPGTENVGGILAFGAAAKEIDTDNSYFITLRNTMKECLSDVPNIKINGSDEFNSGSILNISFLGIKAEILLHALEAKGVYVSTGSACSSHKPQPSPVLTAMGCSKKEIEGAIRISFDRRTTLDEIRIAAQIIAEEAASIRRYM